MSRVTPRTLITVALLLAFSAPPAFAQDFDPEARQLNLRVIALEAEAQRVKGLLKGLFGNDDIIVVLDQQRNEMTRLKNEVGRLAADLAALRAEVRARDTKPGEPPTLTLRAPFAVVGAGGRELMRVSDDESGATIAAPFHVTSKGRSILDMVDDGMTMRGAFKVNNAAGAPVSSLESLPDGSTIFMVGTRLTKSFVALGAGGSTDGFFHLSTKAGNDGVRIGTPEGRGLGVYVFGAGEDKVQASLGLDDAQKGLLRIGDPAGVRGVLGATKSGGISFGLFDRAGPDYRVGLLATPDNSFVRLNTKKNAVHLNADGTGAAVHVFNALGSAAASLQSTTNGYGKFSLGDADGNTMVEAGVTVDQVGIVRAGPRLGGTSGVTQGGLVLPHSIVGQKK